MLASFVLTTTSYAEAQQATKIDRIGYLDGSTFSTSGALVEAFRQRLRELGYVEGQGLVIEYRFADGKPARIPDLA
ncbi:MAG: ABC transporter substrate-binding protein, partial [Candidatus Binatia bacterium]